MSSKTADRAARERIARKIRFLLNNESITVRKLATRIGVSREYLKDVVDAHAWPTRHLLTKLCSVFNVKLEFFGAAALDFEFVEDEVGDNGGAPAPRPRDAASVGVLPRASEPDRGGKKKESPKKRKFDLAELAAHHQALLDCLLEKRVFTADEYQKKLEDVRTRARLV